MLTDAESVQRGNFGETFQIFPEQDGKGHMMKASPRAGNVGATATFLLVFPSGLPATTVKMHKKQNNEIQHATSLETPGPRAKIV